MPDRRKLENAALALPVFGAILMVPPLIGIFNVSHTVFGIPVPVIYLFSLWISLIGATVFLSSRMNDRMTSDNSSKSSPDGDD